MLTDDLTMKKILSMLSARRAVFFSCLVITVAKALFYGGLFPHEVKMILRGIGAQDREMMFRCMMQLSAAVLVVAALDVLLARLRARCVNRMAAEVEDQLMERMNRHCSTQQGKEKLAVLQNTVANAVRTGVGHVYGVVYLAAVLCVSVSYGLFMNKWVVAVGVAVSGILVLAAFRLGRDLSEKAKESESATNDVYGKLWEINDNMEILPFLDETNTYRHLDEAIGRENRLRVEASRLTNRSRIFMRFSHVGSVLLAGTMGGWLVWRGDLSATDLMGIILVLPLVSDSLFQIPAKVSEYHSVSGMCHAIRHFISPEDVLMENPPGQAAPEGVGNLHMEDPPGQAAPEGVRSLRMERLSYRMNEGKELRVPSFCFERGKAYGIRGESGSGKTTLLRILAKLVPAYGGSIRADGRELADIGFSSWWGQVAYLGQEGVILPGTVMDNVLLGRDVRPEVVKKAIRLAALEEFMAAREDADGEIGMHSISGGERQQICLARMFCQEKPVLLLDEATNALSPKNEGIIRKNLLAWAREENRILIFASHGAELLQGCDAVITL